MRRIGADLEERRAQVVVNLNGLCGSRHCSLGRNKGGELGGVSRPFHNYPTSVH